MNIKVNVKDILEVLNKIKHIAKPEKAQPILSSGLFETLDGKIKITVTSFTNNAVVIVPAAILEPGKCLIDISKLVSILTTLSGEVTIEDKETVVWIKQSKTKCRLNIYDLKEYPANTFNIDNPIVEFSMKSKALLDGFKKTVKFTSCNMSDFLSGVLLSVNNSILKFVATDGNRLAVVIKTVSNSDISGQFIFPKESINNLIPLIPEDDDVEIKIDNNSCAINFGEMRFCTRLLEGDFPKYEGIIPKTNDINFSVNREALKYALDRVGVVETKEDLCRVYLSVKNSSLTVESKDYKCNDILNISDKKGDDILFILNRVFLEIVLSVLSTNVVRFSLSSTLSPVMFQDMENLFLIMPIGERGINV